ncbi:MAG: nucleotidyltransferase domain-containing protein [Myxococcales bacterium]|nr:nucleotidyltransferase domain-containing protein [Myxococcales bacterium]MCB9702665.1 nucleotidyltransferase domain-containing protein [Myxococcales bacterium]
MDAAPTLIYETIHGSRAYGLATPASDTDRKGVIIGPRRWYLGYQSSPEQIELDADHVRYEIRKLFRLAAAANPTVLEILWTDPADQEVVTPLGERLLAARDAFLSRRAQGSFAGYALSQLARIKTHRRWLLSPPEAAPTRAEFGLPERATISRDQLGAVETMLEDGRLDEGALTPNFLAILDRERRYRAARREWENYGGWLRTRNPRRAELEARFGYDTKHAMHLVRLLRMGLEILRDGAVIVRRPDADELRAIREGIWSYDQLIEAAESMSATIKRAASASPLPEHPDEEALDRLCDALVAAALGLGAA